MSKQTPSVVITPTQIEGTPLEVAAHIFEKIITPNTEMLLKQNPEMAKQFVFSIMGLGISQYAEFVSTKQFQKNLGIVVHNMTQNLKKERGELDS